MTHRQQHIAFVVNNYPPKIGGLEQHVHQLAHHVAELGHRVTVIALDNSRAGVEEGKVTVHRLRGSRTIAGVFSAPYPGTKRRLHALLKDQGVTLISVHTRFFPMSFVGLRLGKTLRVPVVHTEHGSDHVKGVSQFIGMVSRVVDRTMGRYILKQATGVLAISTSARDFVKRLAGVHSIVFHNAIDTKSFTATPSAPHRQRLVFLGRIVPGKGWDQTLKVAESLHRNFPDLEVHFIGDGIERQRLLMSLESSPLAENAVYHGYLRGSEIQDVLANGILLNPTLLAEGFQTTLLEAIASGAAVVSTPVAAAVYLAKEGAEVRIVQSREADVWSAQVQDLLENGWAAPLPGLIETFDWRSRAQEFVAIAEDMNGDTAPLAVQRNSSPPTG
ncbi:glycosyltransferase family 4 protein [Pseudarthrobacter quantipunctorum]|uniref:D-inositol 3-phosphate glycosyltransferase n=1 Tax=Pseudarthrobacter quantipunctorum TaxID=3128980 RepID=A0ABZ2R8D6_9MICC